MREWSAHRIHQLYAGSPRSGFKVKAMLHQKANWGTGSEVWLQNNLCSSSYLISIRLAWETQICASACQLCLLPCGTAQLTANYRDDAQGCTFLLSFGCSYLIFVITCVVFPAVVAVRFTSKSQCCLKVNFFSILGGRFCCLYINMMACSVLASWRKEIRMKEMLHFMTQWLMLCVLHCGHLTITREGLLCPLKYPHL